MFLIISNKPKLDISDNGGYRQTDSLFFLKNAYEYLLVADVTVGIFSAGGMTAACARPFCRRGKDGKS